MSYWAERVAKAQAKLTKKSVRQTEIQLRKYYKQTMESVIAEFEATYNKLLSTMEEGRQPTPADLYKLDKYWQLQGQLKGQLQKLGDRQAVLLSKNFELHFFEIYYSFGVPSATAFSTISTEAARQMINQIWVADGKSWSQRLWGNTEHLLQTLNDGLIECVVSGKKTTQLKNILQERFGVSYSRADALVRTEMAHIQTQAATQRYKDYGIQEVEIWADEDERRCDICGELHQKRYPIGANVPIPAHPRCRCCVVPVVETE